MNAWSFFQKNAIFFTIGLLAVLLVVSSALTFISKYEALSFNHTKERVEKAKEKVGRMFEYMGEMDKGARGFMITPDKKFLIPYEGAGLKFRENSDTLRAILEEQNYPNMDSFRKTEQALIGYYDLLGDLINLLQQGDKEAALAIYNNDPGYEVWKTWADFSTEANAFEKARYLAAKTRYEKLLKIASGMQLTLLIVGLLTLFFVVYRLRQASRRRAELFADLAHSQNQYLFTHQEQQAATDEQSIIQRLIQSLEQAASFIKEIAQGNYQVDWEGLNGDNLADNENNLAGALVQMREQMKAVKQEDQQRFWATQGLSKVAELTRTHQQEVEDLADALLGYLVPYVQANQGSLFFLQEDLIGQSYLPLAACYAYDKKKFVDKTIKPGQGLVGQTFLEKKTLHLTQVPPNYVQITSGLGEATPRSLLIVPLLFNQQCIGVLELASFSQFTAHQITFLEAVGEVIASAVATVRMNVQTKVLLAQSQESTESLRAQEEEMRQNMEELQATQEEMQRKAQEYETVIEEQKKIIAQTQ